MFNVLMERNHSFPGEASMTTELEPKNTSAPEAPRDSYVKLAMRNMVRKSGTSLKHFGLTTIALLGVLVGLAYLTR
jgi:hypothetical protein